MQIQSRLSLPVEPFSYGADTRPPAPAWLVEATPGAPALLTALDAAKATARAATAARASATRAFREASRTDRDNNWVPLPSIEYDRWRQLKAVLDDAESAERASSRPVKSAWNALRVHLAASEEAAEAARAKAAECYTSTRAAADALRERIAAAVEASSLLAYSGQEGYITFTISEVADLERLDRQVREVFDPYQPLRFVRNGRGAAA